ncbi:APC family permease [Nonomuraea endophytica]|uniref:Heme/copper-type cytochrome/quinol oxidase subunit 3 n=1 Tax=Nonomuraea endophytica TaxID=714136 RepID=A0A7W8A2Q3_9ACTN|nr:APC family permease [Nonomuraea endophytica]MBB5078502.1 heme/copper-type cytochrome/quinol oxidase subunit 3 [Nonomuraea endophytica]
MREWLLHGLQPTSGMHDEHPGKRHSWWQVMCLTGVDYFSTLGYQPGIAALAAGALSPIATLMLVALTLLGALPTYRVVAAESPNGMGSIAMLERLLPSWWGKLLVLVLLGFVATAFIFTITLSASDATAHILENPFFPAALDDQQVPITLLLVAALGAIFLRGFSEAIGLAIALVAVYLALNVVVVGRAVAEVLNQPVLVHDWQDVLATDYSSPLAMVALSAYALPKLALGLSGFETGVAVMPQIEGTLEQRIRGARRLLTTAALIMSVFLVFSSFATAILIPHREFEEGGKAAGRALAYLAHQYLGDWFGTLYDISTIAILWFAGASALTGLLNIVPRYLPRYGMAPDWARAVRPLVLVFTAISFAITIMFGANVESQGGAYATGVLALILSAAVAVTISAARRGRRGQAIAFGVVSAVLAYAFVANVIDRPDGLSIAVFFVIAIIVTSLVSRATRSTELRVTGITLDPEAQRILDTLPPGALRIIANEPDARDAAEYTEKDRETREYHHLPADEPMIFLEVTLGDASEFTSEIELKGELRHGHRVLTVESAAVPNTIAAILLNLRDRTGRIPHVYFHWAEGNPIGALLRYLLFGGGDVPPLTREVLRQAEPELSRRPHVHVG